MYIPSSTYRIQANSDFTLQHIQNILDYLYQLGISTIYCAPLSQAKSGSSHGYDVINPEIINPEIGNLADLEKISAYLKEKNMGWLQDIVPNHMAYDCHNTWLRDVMQKGKHSAYADFFDINWNHPEKFLQHKVMLPILEGELDTLIEARKIGIDYTQEGFQLKCDTVLWPLNDQSYYSILTSSTEGNPAVVKELEHILLAYKNIQEENSNPENTIQGKEKLHELYTTNADVKTHIDTLVHSINQSKELLASILDKQYFYLTPWNKTSGMINYRRFFIVNELICLKMENPVVFDRYHALVKSLLDKQLIQGLRIDHIDGLALPGSYLNQLRSLAGNDTYLIVEKILDAEEKLPSYWPVQGTSGYEFLGSINQLFTVDRHEQAFTDLYRIFSGYNHSYEETVFQKKFFMFSEKMKGEAENMHQLIMSLHLIENPDPKCLKEAMAILMASFPVYRSYIENHDIHDTDRQFIHKAIELAMNRRPDLKEEFLQLKSLFESLNENKLTFALRFQQYTSPLAAKGVEDTVFYVYNRLASHNEVGDTPRIFGVSTARFHDIMKLRKEILPLSLNATSTHDTKRGEDARIRINILSEIPDAWEAEVTKWKALNTKFKKSSGGKTIPSENDEYFIYQNLVGCFPANSLADDTFLERFKKYMIKAVREARTESDWDKPNTEYENAVCDFIDNIIKDEAFNASFLPFVKLITHYGTILSLGQTLIKITAPGIPDTYQGTELWDLSFVDPDNRRAVDYDIRKKYLSSFIHHTDRMKLTQQVMENPEDGRIKMFVTWVALNERRANADVFTYGEYIPLAFSGTQSEYLVGFIRKHNEYWYMTITLKEVKNTGAGQHFPVGEEFWGSTTVILPAEAPDQWVNVFTHTPHEAYQHTINPIDKNSSPKILAGKHMKLNSVLKDFPIGLLKA